MTRFRESIRKHEFNTLVELRPKVASPERRKEKERKDARNADHLPVARQGFLATVASGLSVFRKFG